MPRLVKPMTNYVKYPIFSTVAGVASSNSASVRQATLKSLKELFEKDPNNTVNREALLIRQPDNKYDPHAIQVIVNDVNLIGKVHIGYISNSESYCSTCNKDFIRYPKNGICTECNSEGTIIRNGLASELCAAMDTYNNLDFSAEITSITGGTEDKKSYGCNIRIRGFYVIV